ncbi:unnamed protein product [Scytosiphon promiscuus]
MRDLRRCDDKPFGGATAVLFSGDFRQVGPVVLFGKRADVVEASLIYSHLWKHVQRFRLVQSMRDRLDKTYSKTVRAVGEGIIPPLTLPDTSLDCCSTTVHAYIFHRPGNDIDRRRVHATRSQPVPASN